MAPLSHSLWVKVYDRRVFDFWVSFSSVGAAWLIFDFEGELSKDEKLSAVLYHKYESQHPNISK